ncbi:MAG TPA: EamA family transporter [Phototrophicaceae bacterium]|nr:EamA family transporter [Phototrophicaceae bacterium]
MFHEVRSPHQPSSIWIFLALIFLILVWSLNYVVAKIGLRELPALALASFRIVTAGLVSLPVVLFPISARKQGVKVTLEVCPGPAKRLQQFWTITYLGVFNVVLNQGCYTVGLNYTSVSHSSLIIGCAPILILLFSCAMRLEALTWRKILGMGLAFLGAAAVGMEQARSSGAGVAGDLLTLVAGVGLALYTVLGKRVIEEYGAVRLSLLSNIAAAVLVLPVALWQVWALARAGRLGSVGMEGWGAVLYMGLLASAVAYILYIWALRYMTPARLGAVSYLQPVGAILLGFLLLGEPITRRVAVGGLLIIAGVHAIETHARGPRAEDELA